MSAHLRSKLLLALKSMMLTSFPVGVVLCPLNHHLPLHLFQLHFHLPLPPVFDLVPYLQSHRLYLHLLLNYQLPKAKATQCRPDLLSAQIGLNTSIFTRKGAMVTMSSTLLKNKGTRHRILLRDAYDRRRLVAHCHRPPKMQGMTEMILLNGLLQLVEQRNVLAQ